MRNLACAAAVAVLSLLGAGSASAQTLVSTRSFNLAGGDDELLGVAAAPGGGWYAAGYVGVTSTAVSGADIYLAKIDASLNVVSSVTLDAAGDHDMAYAVAVGSDGMVYAVGASSVAGLGSRLWIGKFDSALSLVKQSTISYGGFGDGNTSLDALVVEPDGNIVAAGDVYVSSGSGGSRVWLGRFDSGLNLVASSTFTKGFGPESADALLRASNGDLYVGGGIAPSSGVSNDLWVGRFNSSLVLQASAAVAGAGGNTDQARGLALGSDGALYVTGIINTSGATVDAYLARFNATTLGLLGTASIAGAAATNDEGQHLINGSSNTLLLAGGFSQSGQLENLWLATVVEGSMAVASSFTQTSAGANTDVIHSVVYDSTTGTGLAVGRLNGAGRDAWWASFSASTAGAQPYPAPSSFAGTALSSSSISWAWTDGVVNELGFRVMSGGVSLSGDLPAGTTSWTQTGLTANTAYGPYHVRAFNAAGTSDSGNASATTQADYPAGALPAVVTAVSPESGAQGSSPSLTVTGSRFSGSTVLNLQRTSGAGSWAATGALPRTNDYGRALRLDDGRVILAGGMNTANGSVVLSSASLYDPGSGTWTDGPSMSSRRHSFGFVKLDDGRVLAAAGMTSMSSVTATAEVYDPGTNQWTLTGSLSVARADAGVVKLSDGRVLVAGGLSPGSVFHANTDIWDPATGSWTARAPLNTARNHPQMVLLSDGRVLAIGGVSSVSNLSSVEVYSSTANAWTTVKPMAAARYTHRATLLPGNRVLVVGGSGAGLLSSAEIYDVATDSWTAAPSMSVARYAPALVALGGRVLVAGGMSSGTGPTATATAQWYDPATSSWTSAGSLGTARFQFDVTPLADGTLLATGGEGSGSTALSSCERFTVTVTTVSATGVSAPSSTTLTGTVNVSTIATGYWDVVARNPGEGRLFGGFRVLAPALSSLSVSPSTVTLTPGATQPLTVVGTYTDGSTGTVTGLVFTSSAPAIASVSTAGVITGVSTGATTVTASSGAVNASANVTVAYLTTGELPAVVTAVAPSSGPSGGSRSLTVTGTRFSGSTALNLQRSSGAGAWAATGALPRDNVLGRARRLDDGRVLVAGGMNTANGSVMLSSTSFYDPAVGTWSDGPSMNSRRHSFALVKLDDGRLLAATGQVTTSSVTATAEVYDPATNLWTPTGSLSAGRADAGFVKLADGRVLVAGGLSPGSVFHSNTDIWDPATGSWTARAPLNTARNHPQLVLLGDGRVLAIGGATLGSTLTSVEVYSSSANAWTTVAPMATARYTHRAALLPGNRVLVVGGSDTSPHSSAEIYDVATDSWTAAPAMSAARLAPALVSLGGRVLVLGGMTSTTGPTATSTAQWFDPALGTWSSAGGLGTARFHLEAAVLGDGTVLVVGGEGDNSTALSSCERLTVAVTTLSATGVSAPSSFTLTGTMSLAGAATGYWDVVARSPGEGRLDAGFLVTTPVLVSLSVTPSSATLEVGGQQSFTAVGTYDNASTAAVTSLVNWASSPTAVATVSTAGVVTAQAAGSAVVTASTGSLVATASVTVSAFPAPTGFGGTALGPTSIRWDWTDNASGELGYRVMSGTVNLSGDLPPNTTSWTQTGLSPNTQYGPYFARVFNSSATADSNSASKKTKSNPPGGSSAPSFSATVATVTWSLNGNPAGTTAEIHRSTDGASFSLLVSSAVTLHRDDSLLGCTSYYYKVRNADEDGFSAYDTTVLVRTLDTVPGAPGSLAAEAVAGGRVYLSWTGSVTEGVTGYKLYGDGGTGTFDYGTPLAVFTSTESSWTTGVLASSAAYAFNLRALHRCGTEDSSGVLATAASTATLAAARAAIKNPDAGKRIAGNSVTVMAELTAGTPQTVSQVAFQYRASTTAPWVDIPAANVNHPNPDQGAPYFTHWNVTALAQGLYHLRAVAYDGSGNPDPAPGSITVIVDAAAPDITENLVAGEIIKQQAVNNAVVNTIASGGGDAGDALAKIVLPPGALSASTVTITVEANPTITTATPSGMAAVGSSLRINLSNGQHNLSGGQTACITLSYPSNVTDPSALSIWSMDEGTGVWSRDFATTVNASSRTITGCTPHFSIFVVFQGVATATLLDGVRLYPNPYKPNSGNLDEGKPFSLGDDSSGIIIDQLPARVTVEIYSLSGRLVTRFDTDASGGRIRWNARNSDGRDVASGGYFAVVSSPGQQSIVKKFIIIR